MSWKKIILIDPKADPKLLLPEKRAYKLNWQTTKPKLSMVH